MIMMTWRQHRLQLAAAAALLAAVTGYLLISGLQRADYAGSTGLTGCLADRTRDCNLLARDFFDRFGGLPQTFSLLTTMPLLAGLFFGAPLIAREVETGTYRLAWTQSVTRRRWLGVKLAGFLAATVLVAGAVSLSFSWWLGSVDQMSQAGYTNINRMDPTAFDLTGIAPIGPALFAFALGTAAGALIRRTIPAMAATLGGYLAVTLQQQSLLYHLFTPLTLSGSYGTTHPFPPGSYILSNGYSDAAGHPVTFSALMHACGSSHSGHGTGVTLTCLAAKGFHFTQSYQPASRYWPLQLIDFSLYGTAALALLALAIWWTTRRIS